MRNDRSSPRASGAAPTWLAGPASRLLSRPCGFWRVPHGIGVPGHLAYVPYRVLARVSVTGGYSAAKPS
jgi:hypothetical protein